MAYQVTGNQTTWVESTHAVLEVSFDECYVMTTDGSIYGPYDSDTATTAIEEDWYFSDEPQVKDAEYLDLSDMTINVNDIVSIDLPQTEGSEVTINLVNGRALSFTDSKRGLADSADYAAILALVSPN